MRFSFFILTASLACAASAAEVCADSFTVDEWYLGIGVGRETGASYDSAGSSFTDLLNPLRASQFASLGNSTAYATYDLSWASQFGHFLIQSSQQTEGVHTGYVSTGSGGSFWITPSVDLALTIDAAWTFNLPADTMDTNLHISIHDTDNQVFLFAKEAGGQTAPGEPASGTAVIDGQIVLPAGRTWMLDYVMITATYPETLGHLGTGNGYVDFKLQPLPEPSTAGLLIFSWLMFAARRRKPR